jgi:hypothetical protein
MNDYHKARRVIVDAWFFNHWLVLCHYCNTPVTRSSVTVDHVKARYAGGKDNPGNFVPACLCCNNRKDVLPYNAFMQATETERLERQAILKRCLKPVLKRGVAVLEVLSASGAYARFDGMIPFDYRKHGVGAISIHVRDTLLELALIERGKRLPGKAGLPKWQISPIGRAALPYLSPAPHQLRISGLIDQKLGNLGILV